MSGRGATDEAGRDELERMLSGGHPNSLGRTVEVVDIVLADRARLDDLYRCYFSDDEVVRLRVSSAMKRVAAERPEWIMTYLDRLQSEIAAIDQASTQWTLALLFDLTVDRLSAPQRARAIEIMLAQLDHHHDWIVLNTAMKVLAKWAVHDPTIIAPLVDRARRLAEDGRRSVATNARRLIDRFG